MRALALLVVNSVQKVLRIFAMDIKDSSVCDDSDQREERDCCFDLNLSGEVDHSAMASARVVDANRDPRH